ncbi:MAG: DUF433 domain-containing protein [Thermoplasmata archaeon]
MVKTIKVSERVHDLLDEFKKKHGLSTYKEAVETAVMEAEGVLDDSGSIVSTMDVLGGQPRIKDTRIGILNINRWYFEEGLSVKEICDHYYVEKEGVEAAVKYIEENPEHIQQLKREIQIKEKISMETAKERMKEIV